MTFMNPPFVGSLEASPRILCVYSCSAPPYSHSPMCRCPPTSPFSPLLSPYLAPHHPQGLRPSHGFTVSVPRTPKFTSPVHTSSQSSGLSINACQTDVFPVCPRGTSNSMPPNRIHHLPLLFLPSQLATCPSLRTFKNL